MLKINKKVEYALMALKHLAQSAPDGPIKVREICHQYGPPFDTTSKVLQSLAQHGIVVSVQGINGGYLLKKELRQICFGELEEIIEGKSAAVTCLSAEGSCALQPTCNIIGPVQLLEQKLNHYLHKLNLEELLMSDQK